MHPILYLQRPHETCPWKGTTTQPHSTLVYLLMKMNEGHWHSLSCGSGPLCTFSPSILVPQGGGYGRATSKRIGGDLPKSLWEIVLKEGFTQAF